MNCSVRPRRLTAALGVLIGSLLAATLTAIPPAQADDTDVRPGPTIPFAPDPHDPGKPLAQQGYWPWTNANSARCLGIAGGNMANGTPAIQWNCSGTPDQQWSHVPINDGLFHRFRNKKNPNKCLGVAGSSTADGARLVIWDCNQHDDQFWSVVPVAAGGYAIVNLHSLAVIGVAGGSTANGAPVVQWTWQNHPDQRWF